MRSFVLPFTGLLLLLTACTTLPPPPQPIRVTVGPIAMDAPVSKSTKIYTFEEAPSSELEPTVRQQLIEEVEVKAQRHLIESLRHFPEFEVMPFTDTRRVWGDISNDGVSPDHRMDALAEQTQADIVLSGHIYAYGQVPLKYWWSTYAASEATQLTVVGLASGGNPIAIGGFLAYDLLTDIPAWTGGFHLFGWAYRPVFVQMEAFIRDCTQPIWTKRQLTVLTHHLVKLPKDERGKKQVQLDTNLQQAMRSIAESASKTLRTNSCATPKQ